MSVYMIFDSLRFSERMWHVNVFSLTLESYESNLDEVLNTLVSLWHLDKRIILELSQQTWVCIFSLCMIKNMSQQQANADFKLQNATLDCRFCLISSDDHENIDFDIMKNDRFHFQTLQHQREMNNIHAITKKETFAIKWELSTEKLTLLKLFSALDIIVTRLSDSAHFKYAELCKQLHHLLLDIMLKSTATQEYIAVLKWWSFASEFARLQSSLHHLKSYSLLKHVRWIVMISVLLICWLKRQYCQKFYFAAMQSCLKMNRDSFIITETIVQTFDLMTRSTSFLMTDKLTDKNKLAVTVKQTWKTFQSLLKIAAVVTNSNSRSRSITSVQKSSEADAVFICQIWYRRSTFKWDFEDSNISKESKTVKYAHSNASWDCNDWIWYV